MRAVRLIALLIASNAVVAGCSGTPSETPTSPTPPAVGAAPAPAVATGVVTVSAAGISPAEVIIPVGTRVTFVNADTRPHDFSGGPDPSRPECPEIDLAGFIVSGQSRQTGVFTSARTCRYHDHAYIGVPAFEGRIVVR